MGVGDSLQAAWSLQSQIPAGKWHLVGDGIVAGTNANQVDVRFDILWRRGASDTVVATFSHHFARKDPMSFTAIPYADDATGIAAAANSGDQLVLKISATAGDPGVDFIPNGDGALAGGAIPRIDLPH